MNEVYHFTRYVVKCPDAGIKHVYSGYEDAKQKMEEMSEDNRLRAEITEVAQCVYSVHREVKSVDGCGEGWMTSRYRTRDGFKGLASSSPRDGKKAALKWLKSHKGKSLFVCTGKVVKTESIRDDETILLASSIKEPVVVTGSEMKAMRMGADLSSDLIERMKAHIHYRPLPEDRKPVIEVIDGVLPPAGGPVGQQGGEKDENKKKRKSSSD